MHTPAPVPAATSDPSIRFIADHGWAKLPPEVKPGYTHGVVQDAAGNFYIANQSEHAILVLDEDGNYLRSFGAAYAAGAHGITIASEGRGEFLLLANTSQAEVVKTDLEGREIWKIGTPPHPAYTAEKKFSPTETAVATDGTVYVTDGYGQSLVHRYGPDGKYLDSFGGGGGAGPGQLKEPHGIAVDLRGGAETLLIANRANRRIDRFSLGGHFLETVIGPDYLRCPCTVVPTGGNLYVPDLFARVSIFGPDDRLIVYIGDYIDGREWNAPWGEFARLDPRLAGYPNIARDNRIPGKFSSPHGLCVDRRGDLIVVEWIDDGRITKLTPQ